MLKKILIVLTISLLAAVEASASSQRLKAMGMTGIDSYWMITKDTALAAYHPAYVADYPEFVTFAFVPDGTLNGSGSILFSPVQGLGFFLGSGAPASGALRSSSGTGFYNNALTPEIDFYNNITALYPAGSGYSTLSTGIDSDLYTAGNPGTMNNKKIDAKIGFRANDIFAMGIGAHYSNVSEMGRMDKGLKTEYNTQQFGGGLGFIFNINKIISINLGLGDFNGYELNNKQKDGNLEVQYTTFDAIAWDASGNLRISITPVENHTMHVFARYEMEKHGTKLYYRDLSPEVKASLGKGINDTDTFLRDGWGLIAGLADEIKIGEASTAYFGLSTIYSSQKYDYYITRSADEAVSGIAPEASKILVDSTKTTADISKLTLKLSLGGEAEINQYFKLRCGASVPVWTTDNSLAKIGTGKGKTELEFDKESDAYSGTTVHFGSALKYSGVLLEWVLSKEIFAQSIFTMNNFATDVRVTYLYGSGGPSKSSSGTKTAPAPDPISPVKSFDTGDDIFNLD